MREVRAEALVTMRSPVRFLMEHIHEAIVNIAPERQNEFDHIFDNFILEYLDDHKWICDVVVAENRIRLSRKVLEVIWASSFAYFQIYIEIEQQNIGGENFPSVEVDLVNDPNLAEACELVRWALDSWLNERDSDWPDGLPRPIEDSVDGPYEKIADELTLCAIAYMLHHELAHIHLRHTDGSNIEDERDADYASADWIFDRLNTNLNRDMFTKRGLGVAIAFAILLAQGIHTGQYDGNTHPRSFDRLLHVLSRHVRNPHDPIWAFVVAVLTFHLDNADHGAVISKGPFDSFKECAESYVDALSRIA